MTLFRVQLAELAEGWSQAEFDGSPADVDLDPAVWLTRLRVELDLDRTADQVTVRGRLRTETVEECGRCLRSFRYEIVTEFTALAERRSRAAAGEDEGVEGYLLYHDGRALDLAEVVRDQAVLARPMSSLCRPACSGLCAHCGSDLNQGACSCVAGGIGDSSDPGRTSL